MREGNAAEEDVARVGTPGEASVVVAYREKVGVATWSRRNAESPVPSRWPYGLDQLGGHLPHVLARDVTKVRGVRRLVGPRRRRAEPGAPAAALAWDEMAAVDMVAAVAAQRYFAGVIWATDAVAAGQRNHELRVMATALRQLDGLWVLSRPQAEALRRWLGSSCPPVHFLRFGVDTDFYAPRGVPQQPHVVSVGGDRDRDPETLFEALRLVRAAHPEAKLTVQSRSAVLPPPGVEKFDRLPHVKVAELLSTATVVALATRPNLHASGMTVGLEAQATGCPVVVTDTPGMTDYFTDGRTAALVPPSDPEALAASIIALLDDPAAAHRMGLAGRASVLEQHSVSTMCAQLAEILQGTAPVI